MKNYNLNILSTIGNTPLIKIENVYAKLETVNPTGSVKDRMVWYMVRNAEKRGELRKGQKIIEITSGNTGIALAMISALKGYRFIAVMPDSMSLERQKMMKTFGAEIVLTPGRGDMIGAMAKYRELIKTNKDAWLPKQFENPDNINAHREGLGKEIIKQTRSNIDIFVAGAGTGGTIIGVAQALKKINPNVKIIVVEPEESAVLSGYKSGLHKIQGIGEGFIPKILMDNINLIDEIVTVTSDEAIKIQHILAKKYGILVGISSGANVLVAMKMKRKYKNKNVVTILPDRGERYLA